jgi:hypothetical protein
MTTTATTEEDGWIPTQRRSPWSCRRTPERRMLLEEMELIPTLLERRMQKKMVMTQVHPKVEAVIPVMT